MEQHREFAMRLYDCLNRRDFDGFLEGISEDVEFRSLIAESEGDTFRGHEGVRAWWVQVAQAMGGLGFEVEEYAEEGNAIVTKIRVRGNVGTTGISQTMWQAVLARGDKIVWWQTFRSPDEAWATVRERMGG